MLASNKVWNYSYYIFSGVISLNLLTHFTMGFETVDSHMDQASSSSKFYTATLGKRFAETRAPGASRI